VTATASIGGTVYPTDRGDAQALIRNAGIATCEAKTAGRNCFRFFTGAVHREILHQQRLAGDIRRGLAEDEFFLAYEPQFHLADGTMSGVEAQLRWRRPDGAVLLPAGFVGIAEELGQIVPIGRWMLRSVFQQSLAWQQAGYSAGRVAVRVTPRQILHATFCEDVEQLIAELQLDPERIQFEITEAALAQDVRMAQRTMDNLRNLGFSLAVHAFGTGYACRDYLRGCPIDTLKLDASFVKDIGVTRHGPAICRGILSIADGLDLDTVAEGVATEQQLRFLAGHGCRRAQGPVFGEPLSAEAVAARLEVALSAA
jgi:EAL domain-containing protein (putative c-di-GMP-specific phosphodiesterase class I)